MSRIDRIEAFVFRHPLETPVATSFGVMRDRPMTLVRVTDRDGAEGWGEVWCNFPNVGAEHRARLVNETLAPLFADAGATPEAVAAARARTRILALQCGEPGPFAQTLAAIDAALHDLAARRAGAPLWRALGGASGRVPVYASGIGPAAVGETAAKARARGFRAFKLKIGFGAPRDRANLAEIRETIGDDALMVDANQAWDVEAAMRGAEMAAEFGALWLEEPLAADAPAAAWRALAAASPVPLAAGENVLGEAAFESLVAEGSVSVIQPDLGKWGGVTGCLAVARRALGAGRRFCPHWLGGGVGLAASAHLLTAAGGDGLLEVDVNPNPFRERLFDDLVVLDGTGSATLPDAPGLGVTPDIDSLAPFRTL